MAPVEDNEAGKEDPPIVLELKTLDDDFLKLQKAYEQEEQALRRQFTDRQKPLLDQRKKVLEAGDSDEKTGTPALVGFWMTALKNHPAFEDEIEKYDMPVLNYLRDIMCVDLDPEDSQKGFRLKFHFVENPYFTNAILSKEYHTSQASPYTGEMNISEIRGCKIDWKAGKNVTVEKVKKTGPKKKKPGKEVLEPRPSFFRNFFRTIKEGSPLPEDVDPHELAMQVDADDEPDEEDLVDALMEMDHSAGEAIRWNIIPFAVRWYTGEAAPDGGDEDEEEEEEEEEEEDD
eukprot:CAMPEP_0197624652 /NCGR_PEP_ID=MMETSP1338-20131121/4218_1 /TAXON_ID=43686 ORGANISM="Pelagodinium beii, Strain RCC1491" /NCGR_SAMPLE_ID=MMETSP1338 /ASSEMBLY_ACC=CAM_ASM_000754 /LENGTH=287 /DNA_ID=CAMNT_0043194831 /DNA_START=31 /DNA_END=894 /DNA_ORIENTATION=-